MRSSRLRRRHGNPTRCKSGFSLLELLVALILVDIALLAIVRTQALVVRRRNDMRARSAAIAAATTRIEQQLAVPCTDTSGAFSTSAFSEAWSQRLNEKTRELTDSVVFGAPPHDVVLRTRFPC